jgi:hypothetical protein
MAFPKMPPVNFIRQLKMFNDGVPRRLRFWLIVMFALFYQFAAGIYLASLSQMVGELSFLNEDVTMGGYCTLIGLNIIFPMLFRWKFGLYTRQLFFVSSIAIILCSIGAMYVTVPVVFWIICVLAGYFKMMGMFGCMSTIQLNITPTRNFAVFFPVIYLLVCGAVQLSGLVTAYVSYFSNWRLMNLVVMAMMLIIDFITYFFMKHDHRSGPPIPLKGIDWVGQFLWTLTCCIAAWIFTFGEHYDWWHSQAIWNGTFLFIFVLAVTLLHAKYKKEPFIPLKAFTYPTAWHLMFLLLGMSILTGSAHVLQPIFLGGVLNYDSLNIISLNYPELAGIIMGAILIYFVLVRWRWGTKRTLSLVFGSAIYFVLSMFYMCDSNTDKEIMYIAYFSLGMSEVMIDTVATYYLSQHIPFIHYFMNITIIGFVRCGVGTAAGAAIVHRIFNWTMAKSYMVVSENITQQGDIESMSQLVGSQSLLVALKECYGILLYVGLIMLVIILLTNYHATVKRFLPRLISVRYWLVKKTKDPTLS